MRIDILTLFPEMFEGFLEHSILGRARLMKTVEINLVQWRDYALDKHRTVDDAPYGGGAGMVLMCEPLFRAVEDLKSPQSAFPETQVIYLTPQGSLFHQKMACQMAEEARHLILVCGRYEGVDERARVLFDREISIGDFVLTGGELPAACLTDAVVRLMPGVLGNDASSKEETHMDDGLFDHPHYTRPEVFQEMAVPSVLLSGHHAKIEAWRRQAALERTWEVRPELVEKANLSQEDRCTLKALREKGCCPRED